MAERKHIPVDLASIGDWDHIQVKFDTQMNAARKDWAICHMGSRFWVVRLLSDYLLFRSTPGYVHHAVNISSYGMAKWEFNKYIESKQGGSV